jgi:D-glycero-D-manno-heptose 1,7-bisphosphate phosphatase
MAEFHGRPFLEYLLEMLRDQGITRVLLLLGYLGDDIVEYFGDGRRLNVEISYSTTAPEDLTAHRLVTAEHLLDDLFLLMYCDNYWPLRIDAMSTRFATTNPDVLVTVYANRDKFSRDNVRVDDGGWIREYDRTRSAGGLAGVEIGYAIMRKQVLALIGDTQQLLEDALYPRLAATGRLAAFVTGHRYYSVGSMERLAATDVFLARRPTVFIDRDGTLNVRPPRAEYVRSYDEFQWLNGAREALTLLTESGYRVLVVTNQAGVARRALSEHQLVEIHRRMSRDAAASGGRIDGVYYCPHDWDAQCDCRKPAPGMLHRAQRDFHLDLSRVVFIGDDPRDAEAADAAGCPSMLVSEQRSLLDVATELIATAGHEEAA